MTLKNVIFARAHGLQEKIDKLYNERAIKVILIKKNQKQFICADRTLYSLKFISSKQLKNTKDDPQITSVKYFYS